jgi:hypothetical protein
LIHNNQIIKDWDPKMIGQAYVKRNIVSIDKDMTDLQTVLLFGKTPIWNHFVRLLKIHR